MKEEEIGPHVTRYRKLFDDLSKISVPVIAALDGAALGKKFFFVLRCITCKLQILRFLYFLKEVA
jgi:enoyl-CoA hydratase/carnithine racemase